MSLLKLITFRQQPSGGGYVMIDPDAQAFVSAANVTNDTQKQAVDNLTISLKNNNLWSKMSAIYPFVGGTAFSHSFNLKNPAQYQITWNGTVTHDQYGFQGDGSTGYGNTNLNAIDAGPSQRVHGSVYCRTPFVPSSTGFTAFGSIAVQSGFFTGIASTLKANDNNSYYGCHDSIISGSSNIVSDTRGFFVNTSNPNTNAWQSVCWSPQLSLFVAVANSGTGNRVMTSPDGINWTTRTSAADNGWGSVCWSPTANGTGLFCAVAVTGGTGNRVMTSPDGINWTIRTSAADNQWRSVCWSPSLGLFVAVSSSGTNRVMTSPDGINWTIRTVTAGSWYSVCWSPELGLFAAVGQTNTNQIIITSPDGINWTTRTSPFVTNWRGVVWSPTANGTGLFVATTAGNFATSPDGINWTVRTVPNLSQIWSGIDWSPQLNLFVTFSSTGSNTSKTNEYMTSPDGINWTNRFFQLDNGQSLSLSGSKKMYKNGSTISSVANGVTTNGTTGAGPIYVGARHLLDNTGNYYPIGTELAELFSIAQYSFMSFGLQLSAGDAFVFNTIVQAYQTALSRQV